MLARYYFLPSTLLHWQIEHGELSSEREQLPPKPAQSSPDGDKPSSKVSDVFARGEEGRAELLLEVLRYMACQSLPVLGILAVRRFY